MKRIIANVVAMLLIMACMARNTAYAQEANAPEQKAEKPKVISSAGIGIYNKYVWRGYQLGKSFVIQPTIALSYYGFSAGIWGNWDTKEKTTQNLTPDRPDSMSWNETDLTASYNHAIDKLSLTAGWIYYGTKYMSETHELFLSAIYDVITKPTLTIYRDIASYPGTYFNLAFSHSFPLYKEPTLDLGASFGYWIGDGGYWRTYDSATGAYTGSKYNAPHDGMFKAGLTVPVTKNLSLQPIVQYWFPLSSKAKRWVNGNGYIKNSALRDTVVYGLGATLNF